MKGRRLRWPRRRIVRFMAIAALVVGILFLGLNATIAFIYWHRALPNTYLGRAAVGGQSYDQLRSLPISAVMPTTMSFTLDKAKTSRSLQSMGVHVDLAASVHILETDRGWLPMANFFGKHYAPIQLSVDDDAFSKAASGIATVFYRAPTAQHIDWNGSDFVIVAAEGGQELNSAALRPLLLNDLRAGQSTLVVPMKAVPPLHTAADAGLPEQQKHLQQQLNVKIGFKYNGQTVQPSKADMGGWFVASGQTMALGNDKVTAYISGMARNFGVTAANQSDLVTATVYAFDKGQGLTFAVVPAGGNIAVRTYCTATRQVSDANLSELIGKLAATYADARGWSDGGRIAFQHVDSGCQYTVWLSAASQMTSFGAICDNYYNCQVGTNVVLNYDRWASATTPWNDAGGSLEDYHTLMIDHETGHRLGFLDNPTCPGAGQAAPVMMQQSIDLKGCVFNIWPLASELTQLNAVLGL